MKHSEFGTFLGLTGQRLKGIDNVHAGIATHICEKSKIQELKSALAECDSNETVEQVLLEFQENSLKSNVDLNARFTLEDKLDLISECFKFNKVSEILAALEASNDEWGVKQATALKKMSPTSLVITLEQLRRGANLNLEEVLNMEHGIGSECMEQKDFYEGIRAVLVDRDHNPKWDQSEVDLERYFKGSKWAATKW